MEDGFGLTGSLTTGVDTLTGTSANDTFIADNSGGANKVTSAADTINGGNGTDTLKVFEDGSATATILGNLSSVETIYLNNDAAGLDVSAVTGLTSLVVDVAKAASSDTFTLAGQAVTLSNQAAAVTYTIASATDTAESITLSKIGTTAAATVAVSGTKVTGITVTSTGAVGTGSNQITLTDTGLKAATVTIKGDAALTATIGSGAVNGFVSTGITGIDASADTAATTLIVSGAASAAQNNLAATFAYKGGTANDSLDISAGAFVAGAAITAAQVNKMTFDGGTGTNTIIFSSSIAAGTTAITSLVNEQIIGIDTAAAAATMNMANFSGATGVKIQGTDAGAFTITALASAATLDIGKADVSAGLLTVNAVGTGTADTLAMSLGNGTTAATAAALTISGYETVGISSTAAANTFTGAVAISPSAGGAETVNLTLTKDLSFGSTLTLTGSSQTLTSTGSGALSITGVLTAGNVTISSTGAVTANAANAVLNFDASADNAAISFKDTGATGAAIIKVGNGNDTIVGSNFADVITVGSGTNSITGGIGADTLTINHAALTNVDTLVYGATGQTGAGITANGTLTAVDVITGAVKGDKIDISAFANTLVTVTAENAFSGTETAGTGTALFMVRGGYNATTGVFTASSTGADSLVEFDNNGSTAGGAVEAVVLVGYANATAASTAAAGVITLG